jgi:hypothetical protein
VLALVLVLFLAACTGSPFGNTNNGPRNYYTGSRGVIMQFADPQSPPSQVYYYQDAEYDDNKFNILVDVRNDGASYAKGGLYIGGYDPYMFLVEDMNIPNTQSGTWEDCFLDFNNFNNFNSIGGTIQCSTAGTSGYFNNKDSWGASVNRLGDVFNIENEFLSNLGLTYNQQGDDAQWGINFGDASILGNTYNNGKAVNFMIDLLNFERYNGRGYGPLEPDTASYPGGEQTLESFDVTIRNWPQGLDSTNPIPFMVTNCYAYSTYAAPQVCIDPAPFDNRRKACREGTISYNSNGAPVAITNIDTENTGRKTFFDITIQNVGPGDVYDLGYVERCNPYSPYELRSSELNKLYIIDARIGGQPLKCTPDRYDGVRLINGRGQVRCEYNIEYGTVGNAYQTELVMELAYGYAEFMQRTVTVRRV